LFGESIEERLAPRQRAAPHVGIAVAAEREGDEVVRDAASLGSGQRREQALVEHRPFNINLSVDWSMIFPW
jgi:hypothetical protein